MSGHKALCSRTSKPMQDWISPARIHPSEGRDEGYSSGSVSLFSSSIPFQNIFPRPIREKDLILSHSLVSKLQPRLGLQWQTWWSLGLWTKLHWSAASMSCLHSAGFWGLWPFTKSLLTSVLDSESSRLGTRCFKLSFLNPKKSTPPQLPSYCLVLASNESWL